MTRSSQMSFRILSLMSGFEARRREANSRRCLCTVSGTSVRSRLSVDSYIVVSAMVGGKVGFLTCLKEALRFRRCI
jgi:hypothetical protein